MLQQLKVLDFSTLLPGPWATMLLADMGADVLRVESSTRPDMLRTTGALLHGQSAAHLMINRNKRSLALDLKSEAAATIIHALIKDYDIIIEQFRPGVMARLGFDYDTLKAINPSIIYCSITGYGQTGDYKQKAGHDINYQAISGLASYSGRTETGPVLHGLPIADVAGGSHHAVMAILAAVIERQTTGEGRYLDISMTDAAFRMNGLFGAGALATGDDLGLSSELLNGGHIYDYYETADGRYLSIGSLEPQFARQLFEVLEQPSWLALAASQEPSDIVSLKQQLAALIAQQPLAHWVNLFNGTDCCVEPVLTFNEAADSDLMRQRDLLCDVELPQGEIIKQLSPFLAGSNVKTHDPGRQPGENTRDVLKALDFSDATVNKWLESGAVTQF